MPTPSFRSWLHDFSHLPPQAELVAMLLGLLLPFTWPAIPVLSPEQQRWGFIVFTVAVLLMLWPRLLERVRLSRWLRWSRLLLLLAAASTWTVLQQQPPERPAAWFGQPLTLSGCVDDLPDLQAWGQRWRLSLIEPAAQGRIQLDVPRTWHTEVGQCWRVQTRLKPMHAPRNPGTLSPEPRWQSEDLWARGRTQHAQALKHKQTYFWAEQRARVRARLQQALPQAPHLGLMLALVMGDEASVSTSDRALFNALGLQHLISISGLHITMLAGLAAGLTSWLWRRSARLCRRYPAPWVAAWAGWLSAGGYSLLAGWSVPTQRSFWMLTVLMVSVMLQRRPALGPALLWAAVWVLLPHPESALSPGFWLSFLLVAVLVWAFWGQHAPQPSTVPSTSRLQHGLQRAWTHSRAALSAQGVITLFSLPLLLALFGQFPVASPLANLWAIPWVSLVITPLCLLATVLPGDGALQAVHALFALILAPLQHLAELAGPPWVHPLAWPLAGASMAACLLALLPLPRRLRGLALALAVLALFCPRPPLAQGQWRLTMLDVGQGLAVLVETRDHQLLYDAGPAGPGDSNAMQRVGLAALRQLGVQQLDGLILSHNDRDHTGGSRTVASHLQPRWVLGRVPASQAWRQGLPWVDCQAGQHWTWNEVAFEILHPGPDDTSLPDNNQSCVLRVQGHHGAALLTGDLEQEGEHRLLARTPMLRSEVLVVAHHGGKNGSGMDLLQAVQPRWALISAGFWSPYHHPHPSVLERLRTVGSQPLNSADWGAVQISPPAAVSQAWSVHTARAQAAPYPEPPRSLGKAKASTAPKSPAPAMLEVEPAAMPAASPD